jgi:hypothetical protein
MAHAAAAAGDHGQTDRMIDRSENTDDKQADANLEGGGRRGGGNCRQASTNEKDGHHTFPAPAVSQPTGRQRKQAEGDEPRRRIRDQFCV